MNTILEANQDVKNQSSPKGYKKPFTYPLKKVIRNSKRHITSEQYTVSTSFCTASSASHLLFLFNFIQARPKSHLLFRIPSDATRSHLDFIFSQQDHASLLSLSFYVSALIKMRSYYTNRFKGLSSIYQISP